jgi:hypothetical protein
LTSSNSFYTVVVLPEGVFAGQTIHVQAPDGRLNAIVVPPGFGPGSKFTVEFAPDEQAMVPSKTVSQYITPTSVPPGDEDGFATGFGNHAYQPPVSAYVPATNETEAYAMPYVPSNHGTSYPTTEATPLCPSAHYTK